MIYRTRNENYTKYIRFADFLPPWSEIGKEIIKVTIKVDDPYYGAFILCGFETKKEGPCEACRKPCKECCKICNRAFYCSEECKNKHELGIGKFHFPHRWRIVTEMSIRYPWSDSIIKLKSDYFFGWILSEDMDPVDIHWSIKDHKKFGAHTRRSIKILVMIWMRKKNWISTLPKDVLYYVFTGIDY
jgi:hypothetical protein